MPHQHVHNLTPYPLMAEGSSFPFPSVLPQHPMASSSSSSSSSSYASFRYPRPHATSHPSASFPLSLATIHSPVPPSLLARRRSSCSTVHSVASNSTSASSTESWGNWSTESPPALSRSGSVSSRNGAMDIKTPETVIFPDFEDAISHRKSTSASAFTSTFGSMSDVFDHPSSEDYSHDHNEPAVPISATKRAGISRPRARLFVTLAEPSSAPRLQRKQTPLEPFTLGSSGSGLFGAGSRIITTTTATTAETSTATSNKSTKTTTTTPIRPKFVRKVTPHPATTPTTHLPSPEVKGTKHFVPDLSTLVLNETDEDEAEEELEEEREDDRPRGRSPFPARAFALERPGVGRRFSSVIMEGTVWLAV